MRPIGVISQVWTANQLASSDLEVPVDEERPSPQPFVNRVEVIQIVASGWGVRNISLIVAVASVLLHPVTRPPIGWVPQYSFLSADSWVSDVWKVSTS